MSVWTHLCGCIRIDAIREADTPLGPKLERIINQSEPPCGSEGGIHYAIRENPNPSDIPAFTITVWGDLRDYADAEAASKWFQTLCDTFNNHFEPGWIRQAVISIETEGQPPLIYNFNQNG